MLDYNLLVGVSTYVSCASVAFVWLESIRTVVLVLHGAGEAGVASPLPGVQRVIILAEYSPHTAAHDSKPELWPHGSWVSFTQLSPRGPLMSHFVEETKMLLFRHSIWAVASVRVTCCHSNLLNIIAKTIEFMFYLLKH